MPDRASRNVPPDLYPAGPVQAGAAVALLAVALLALAIAWAFELVGGFTPCALCLQQREGYYAAIPLLALAFAGARLRWPACATRGLLVLAGLMLATSLTTAVYQAGAEWGFWLGPNDCGAGGLPAATGGSLLEEMNATRIIFCDEAPLRVLGLSFAGWNVLSAGALTLGSLLAAAWPADRR